MEEEAPDLNSIMAAIQNMHEQMQGFRTDVTSEFQGVKNNLRMLQNDVDNVKEDVNEQRESATGQSRRISTTFDMRTPIVSKQAIQTIAQEHVVPEDQKIRKITLKSSMKLFEDYNRYMHTSMDKTKTITSFVSTDALKDLVDNENKVNTSLLKNELTYSTIHSADNEVIKKIIANKVRPQTSEEYATLIYENITMFKPLKPTKTNNDKNELYTEFVVKNYDKYMHPAVLKLLDELETFDNLFRLGVTEAEISYMPKMEYGSKKNPGVFRIFIQCFNDYKENYIMLLTETKLKSLNTLVGYIMLVKEANNEVANLAKKVRELEIKMTPILPTEDAFSGVRNAKLQEGFKRGTEYKKNISALKSMEHDIEYPEIYRGEEEVDSGDSNTLALYKSPAKPAPKNVQFKAPATGATQTYKTEPVDYQSKICFVFARTGACDAGTNCVYSHDPKECEKYLAAKVAEFSKSPMYKSTQSPSSSQFNTPTNRSPYTPGMQTPQMKVLEEEDLPADGETQGIKQEQDY